MAKKQIDEITSIEDIQALAKQGFENWLKYGDVHVTQRGDLLLFDYTTAAHMANRWNFFERVSRGLMINRRTGEIVARPFDKFFYWLEGWKASGHIVSITEKVDGSLGILFRHKGEYHVSTKGSFFSPQARWATNFLRKNFDLTDLPEELTLLFEILYPDNRIIVDYGQREDLVLLAARNRFTGEFTPYFPDLYELGQKYGFTLPRVYTFNSVDDVMAATGQMDANFEGWVVEFSGGQQFKFKIDEYIEIHKLMRGLDFPNVLKAVANGDIKRVLQMVPDEFLDDVKVWIAEIQIAVSDIKAQVFALYYAAPKESREVFIRWAQDEHPALSAYLLAMYHGEDVEQTIYRKAFEARMAEKAMWSMWDYNPDQIVAVGTQIVINVEVMLQNGNLLFPRGTVGVIVKSPPDNTHAYRIKFLDDSETALHRREFTLRKHYQNPLESGEANFNLYDYVVYRCVTGSRAYGLDHEGSDTDMRGIYLPPADLHWSLYGVPEQLENDEAQESFWEMQKFIVLALKANPNILECLYTPLVEHITPIVQELIDIREIFVTQMIYQTYNGYVMSQFKKMQQDIRNHDKIRWKHAMHLIRLLLSGITALREGYIPVRVEEHRDELLAIRHEQRSWEDVNEWRLSLHKTFDEAFQNTKLPERPDYERANAYLIAARRSKT